jgi:hypothetical protein
MLSLCLFAALSPEAGARGESAAGARTVVLFGANWCAPCRAELRQLPALVAMAAPDRVVLAWLDRPPAVARSHDGIRVMTPAEARALFRDVPGNQGVPLTAMLDASGRVCAQVPEALHAGSLARLRGACAGGQPREAASALAPFTRKSVSLPASTRS